MTPPAGVLTGTPGTGADGSDLPARLARVAHTAGRAPSKHNTQPWRFVVRTDALEVWPDPARVLPETDPHRRELLLACGAAAQTALLVALGDGLDAALDTLPEGTGGPVARVRVLGTREAQEHERELSAAVLRRRTDRGPLDATRLSVGTPFLLQQAAAEQGAELRLVTAPGERDAVARLLLDADHRLARRPSTVAEVVAWSREDSSARRDGVAATATRGARASYDATFVQRDFSLRGSVASHDRDAPDLPLLAVLATERDAPADWVHGGRALAQLLLELTLAGGAASFLNQVVEDDLGRAALRDALGTRAWPQLVLRLGVGGQVPASRRRPVDDVVVHGS
ncbi:MAG: nitroreductase [Frankiales bacterium]|nr:nitroreductase [Frankiales bacterium]